MFQLHKILFKSQWHIKKPVGISGIHYLKRMDCHVNNVHQQRHVRRLQWSPRNITTIFSGETKLKYFCIVLNREVRAPPDVVRNIWENAQLRCLVDGGANRWKDFLQSQCQGQQMKLPDLITGDFDSVTNETLEYFKSVKCVHTPDQNATDFTKSIGVLKPFLEKENITNVVVFQDTSGRLDQIMSNINTLYKVQNPKLNVYMLSGNSMTWLLLPGKHSIFIPAELVKEQRWCALMPIGGPARNVTTQGLKWNLRDSTLEFGGLISTSNTYEAEEVQIDTDNCLVWSMGLFCFEDSC